MDNPISDINNGLKAAEGTISFLDKIFATADKWGFLPMPERRKKNMQIRRAKLEDLPQMLLIYQRANPLT